MKTLLIGCGKMGGALLERWVTNSDYSFVAVDPVVEAIAPGAELKRTREELGDDTFDMIIVAIKPQMVDDILPTYRAHLAPGGVVASIAAGCSVERLQAAMECDAIVRIMPNLPAAIGKGVSGLYATPGCTAAHKAGVEAIISLSGISVWVSDEDQLDRLTAVSGSGPGYVFEMARAYMEAAKSLGFDEAQAKELTLGTLIGTIEMAIQSDKTLETLRNSVTSKKGTTEAGLNALNGDGAISRRFVETFEAAYNRAVALR